ncbi:MAG: DUF4365 domain-containing protein [Bacteroidetes bacterium]|nr:DUF4365 domain-containing protein [Bacteroidota bacterium]
MTTKWTQNKKTEFLGVDYVAQVINKSNSIFNKVDGSNDIGLDGYIEFIENESATGLCVGIQIKSGNSYQSANKEFAVITADVDHFEFWKSHILPIAGVVYIPEDDIAYWIDLSTFLKDNDLKGPYTIRISKKSIFTHETFSEFYKNFIAYKNKYNTDWNFGKALKGLLPIKDRDTRIESIKSLFYFHRNDIESWYYIINQFMIEDDFDVENVIIFTLRHVISHGDIFWHKGNFVNDSVRSFARGLIKDKFSKKEIAKLVRHIDEGGITRGSMGQNIYPIIDLVTEKIDFLKNVILDKSTDDNSRTWAGVILINEFQQYDIDRAIKFAESMIYNFPDSENTEQFELIRDSLRNDGFVDFTG